MIHSAECRRVAPQRVAESTIPVAEVALVAGERLGGRFGPSDDWSCPLAVAGWRGARSA